jgi:hypothetical protein
MAPPASRLNATDGFSKLYGWLCSRHWALEASDLPARCESYCSLTRCIRAICTEAMQMQSLGGMRNRRRDSSWPWINMRRDHVGPHNSPGLSSLEEANPWYPQRSSFMGGATGRMLVSAILACIMWLSIVYRTLRRCLFRSSSVALKIWVFFVFTEGSLRGRLGQIVT